MDWKRILLAAALLAFLASTVRALTEHSYLGFFLIANENSATKLMLLDLTIALTLVVIWMVRDARRHEKSFIPHIVLTLFFGVAGPLVYLVARPLSRRGQRIAAIGLLGALGAAAALHWDHDASRSAAEWRDSAAAAEVFTV